MHEPARDEVRLAKARLTTPGGGRRSVASEDLRGSAETAGDHQGYGRLRVRLRLQRRLLETVCGRLPGSDPHPVRDERRHLSKIPWSDGHVPAWRGCRQVSPCREDTTAVPIRRTRGAAARFCGRGPAVLPLRTRA